MMGYRGVAADTIMEWNRHFRRDGKFPHPDPYFANGIRPKLKPALFEFFPQAAIDITDFIIKHQDHFTVDIFCIRQYTRGGDFSATAVLLSCRHCNALD